MRCPHCQQQHPDGVQFCPITGAKIIPSSEGVCQNCETIIPPQALNYCPACGRPLNRTDIKINRPSWRSQRSNTWIKILLIPGVLFLALTIWYVFKTFTHTLNQSKVNDLLSPTSTEMQNNQSAFVIPQITRIPTGTARFQREANATNELGPSSTLTISPSLTSIPTQSPTRTVSPTPIIFGPIAYVRGRSGQWQIDLYDPNTAANQILQGLPSNSGVPSFSPDGERLAFQATVNGIGQIFTINMDGTDLLQLTFDGENFDPAWSPSGSKIAFTSTRDGNFEIYVMDTDGENQVRITHFAGLDDDASWAPDGRSLVLERENMNRVDIYSIDINEGEESVRQLTFDGYFNSTPAWSPDGKQIAYERQDAPGTTTLYLQNLDTGEIRRLTDSGTINVRAAWSGNGQAIAWTSNRGGSVEIWIMDLSGSSKPYQISTQGGFDAAWARR